MPPEAVSVLPASAEHRVSDVGKIPIEGFVPVVTLKVAELVQLPVVPITVYIVALPGATLILLPEVLLDHT